MVLLSSPVMACAVGPAIAFLFFLLPAPVLGLCFALPLVCKLKTQLRRWLGTVFTFAAVPVAYKLIWNCEAFLFTDHGVWPGLLVALTVFGLVLMPGIFLSLPPLPRKNRDDIEL